MLRFSLQALLTAWLSSRVLQARSYQVLKNAMVRLNSCLRYACHVDVVGCCIVYEVASLCILQVLYPKKERKGHFCWLKTSQGASWLYECAARISCLGLNGKNTSAGPALYQVKPSTLMAATSLPFSPPIFQVQADPTSSLFPHQCWYWLSITLSVSTLTFFSTGPLQGMLSPGPPPGKGDKPPEARFMDIGR